MLLLDDPKQNIQTIKLLALRAFDGNVIRAQLCVAQAILESRLNRDPSKLAKDYNNLFGIKGTGTHKPPSIFFDTQEHSNSQGWFEVHTGFAWNNCLEDSIEQYKTLLDLPRYKSTREAKSFVDAAQGLISGGYATDPGYARKLIKICGLYLQDMI